LPLVFFCFFFFCVPVRPFAVAGGVVKRRRRRRRRKKKRIWCFDCLFCFFVLRIEIFDKEYPKNKNGGR
jgi:hypothetical protein